MAAFTDVRAALAAQLALIDGLNVYEHVAASIEPPAAVVALAPGRFLTWDTSRGSDDYAFSILVLVASGDYAAGQAALDAYLDDPGATSIKLALEADPDLGGACDWVEAHGAEDVGLITVGGGEYWGFRVPVTVGVSD